MTGNFEQSLQLVLKDEGKFSNLPADRGRMKGSFR